VQGADQVAAAPLSSTVVRIGIATALGLFLGLEREWSQKAAGIRTFSLTSLLAAVFVILGGDALLVLGGLLVVVQGVLLAVRNLVEEGNGGLNLTTSVSLMVAYGVGALVARDAALVDEAVAVAVLSSLLLVLKRELHTMAWGLEREELRSAAEFAVLAFVVYPLLPTGSRTLTVATLSVEVEPRVIWLLVVTVAAIGVVNYALVKKYGGRGIAITGFFGGLASSTAVVGTMIDYVKQRPDAVSYGVAAILLADAAMALRNIAIAVGFTFVQSGPVLTGPILPLGVIVVGAVGIAYATADWSTEVDMDLESPFSLRNALAFGVVFLLIVVAGAFAQSQFQAAGFYVTALLSGLVSSAGVTASAVTLYRTGTIESSVAVVAILLATASSVGVKVGLTALGDDREFARQVAMWSGLLLLVSGASAVAVVAS